MYLSNIVVYGGLAHLGLSLYQVRDVYNASNWLDSFTFDTEDDPTFGYVDYVDQDTALGNGMFRIDNDVVIFGVDNTTIATGRGRPSVRLFSDKLYNHGLVVADIAHMPGSVCGTWNAFWMTGSDWPNNGEIDIIEGVNSNAENMMSQHTSQGCRFSEQDCSADVGCSQTAGGEASYGSGFNANGGGVYALEWTSDHINIWFWPNGTQPSDLSDSPDPAGWDTPTASFNGGQPATTCDIDSYFRDQSIIFDTTFCGSWAGEVFSADPVCSALGSTCVEYVQNNPSAFLESYWAINSVKVYELVTPTTYANTTSTVTITNTIETPTTEDYATETKDVDTDNDDNDDDDNDDDDNDDADEPKKKHHHHHHHHHHHGHHHGHHHHHIRQRRSTRRQLKFYPTAPVAANIPMPTI